MKAQELRIGNYIYKKIHKKDTPLTVVEVLSIDGYFDVLDVKNSDGYITEKFPLNDFERIPLTEEFLLRFGFKINRQTKEENNIWRCSWTEGHFEVEQIIGFFLWDNHFYGTEIKYVHQLQNIYFAITGEELTIY